MVAYHGTQGLIEELYHTTPGESFVTSLSQDIAPAQYQGRYKDPYVQKFGMNLQYQFFGGTVVEAGRHEELLRKGGRYASFYRLQLRDQEPSPRIAVVTSG